jgi:hypothetical protein
MIKIKRLLKLFALVTLTISMLSCDEKTNEPLENQAPDTFMFLYPDSGVSISQQKSRLNVHWWGDDPDGLVIGYYFQWEGIDAGWNFTTKNDSLFSLPIGTVDTNFTFRVMAVDNNGNGVYDNSVMWNGIDLGPEPFIDRDNNGVYSNGDDYYDIGAIDPTPAEQNFPIRNSPPEIRWNDLSVLPASSFPVITLGWDVSDLDGDESVVAINLSLNDTSSFVTLEGNVRLVSLRSQNIFSAQPTMQILINGSQTNIASAELQNLLLDANNRIYVQAVDISGSKSPFAPLPDTSQTWFVRKPKGKFIIVDDYQIADGADAFYNNVFDNVQGGMLAGKYDVLDLENTVLPYENVTFLETLKLFDYIYWYSGSSPNLGLINLVSQKYIDQGGKIAYSMTFQDSSSSFTVDLPTLQNFLPIAELGEEQPLNFLFSGANVLKSNTASTYPSLRTSSTISFVRTYVTNTVIAEEIYDVTSNQINGNIAFLDLGKNLFFIGLPLHHCNGISGSVEELLGKILFEEFGLTP